MLTLVNVPVLMLYSETAVYTLPNSKNKRKKEESKKTRKEGRRRKKKKKKKEEERKKRRKFNYLFQVNFEHLVCANT
jgi:hypothetical protein